MNFYKSKWGVPKSIKWALDQTNVAALTFIFTLVSCKKFVEIDPPINQIISQEVYNKPSTAAGVLTGIYYTMSSGSFATGPRSLSVLASLSADELGLIEINNDSYLRYYTNNLSSTILAPQFWSEEYALIFSVNAAVEGLSASSLYPEVKRQLIGEALFLRALFYFYLVNIYGDIPLILSTDYKSSGISSRTEIPKVYEQIIIDLKDAENLLNENYLEADVERISTERIRPNKSTATALLARVYLYTEQWSKAEEKASEIINKSDYELVNLDEVFLKNSKEAIWQLQPTGLSAEVNTLDAQFFIPAGNPIVYISDTLVSSFESGDNRLSSWINNTNFNNEPTLPYPFKYKVKTSTIQTEYVMVLRLAEQYLIRSEARINLDNISGGIQDLNRLRTRARAQPDVNIPNPLPALTELSKDEALAAVEHERKLELFSEWGHRWLDLKRTKKVNQTMEVITPLKGGIWSSFKQLYPIPQEDINKNPSLSGKQNVGY